MLFFSALVDGNFGVTKISPLYNIPSGSFLKMNTYVHELLSSTELSSLSVSQLTLFIGVIQSTGLVQGPGLYHTPFGWVII